MKKIIQWSLLLAIASIACMPAVWAQHADKDMLAFTKKFQDLYNKKDANGIKMLYTDDAVRTNTDGQVFNGNAAISEYFTKLFAENNLTIVIKQEKVESNADGSLTAMGTYHAKGTSKAGEKVVREGHYHNTLVKSDGHWKISKSVLTALK